MGNFVYNMGLGRVAEMYRRVRSNDPANSAFVIAVAKASGLESDASLRDRDLLSGVFSVTTVEATNTGYARKILTDADLVAYAHDDANDRVDLDFPDQTWTSVQATGGGWGAIVIGFDFDTTAGTDVNIETMTHHSFVVTPDGSDITLQVGATGFYRASN